MAAVVAAPGFGSGDMAANVDAARRYVARAVEEGADLVCFPETFPGAWRSPITSTPIEDLQRMAAEAAVHVIGGFAEPIGGSDRRCYNTVALIDPEGNEVGRYRRTLPRQAPWIYEGSAYWDFDWVPADQVPTFETALGTIGMLVCSEIYSPELPRILALKGAEIIVMPAGLAGPQRHPGGFGGALYATWRTLAWARAIENLAYTVVCSNVPSEQSRGVALVCSPEEVVMEEEAVGVHVVDLDLERVRWLRSQQDGIVAGPSPWRTKPGVLRDWRRTEIFAANPVIVDG